MNNKYPSDRLAAPKVYQARGMAWSILTALLLFGGNPVYADRYVATNGADTSPYDLWTRAATNIQDAVNFAAAGETVWVSNGIYFSGPGTVYSAGDSPTMVVITNAITLRSWSGNYSDTILNANYPSYSNRVLIVSNLGAEVSGLTLTNAYIYTNALGLGPGVWFFGRLLTNCLITGNYTPNANNTLAMSPLGLNLQTGTVSHCAIIGNKSLSSATIGTTPVSVNVGLVVSNCVIAYNGNPNAQSGGTIRASKNCIIVNSEIYGNSQHAIQINDTGWLISNCRIYNNDRMYAIYLVYTFSGTIKNCLVYGNKYGIIDGGTASGSRTTIENCTIVNNKYQGFGGDGADSTNLYAANCIIYDNYGNYENWYGTNISFSNCCTYNTNSITPGLPPNGTGNTTSAPALVNTNAGNYRLSNLSPCVNTGANREWMTNGVDLDGRQRIRYGTVDMGCYERIYSGTIFTGR